MQIDWIKKEGNKDVLVVALGWGASKEVVENQVYDNYDVVVICDYCELDYDFATQLTEYKNVSLLAWSFGVWASEQLFGNIEFKKAIAVGGTPIPIDRNYGIPPRVFDITVSAILNEGVVQFVVRMCGKHLKDYMRHFSKRPIEDAQKELSLLNVAGRVEYAPKIKWTKFVNLQDDLIFPPKNIENYAKEFGFDVVKIDAPHYPFYDKDFIRCAIKS